ncbi:UNVERIFIED_CONTAM: hypothetical protein Sangu_2488200 [Sesamum angustifolium]|uniref:DDE Tnp4 domain-containing protein n=1 Tax=Sesamum angustifolium TaxID=2727405 RepID=A0AAW2KPS8_9LAMI
MRSDRSILALIAVQKIMVDIVVGLFLLVYIIHTLLHKQTHLVVFDHADILLVLGFQTKLGTFTGGLSSTKRVTIAEQVAMFLSVIAHHKKNCVGCLGALDGTFIDVRVPEHDKGRYRTRKGHIAVNVLGVCNPNMQFIYVLSGWEGSAADSHVYVMQSIDPMD